MGASLTLWERVDGRASRLRVPGGGLAIVQSRAGAIATATPKRGQQILALVVPFDENGAERALLLTPPAARRVWLDGCQPIAQVLEPRAELRVADRSFWLGTDDAGEAAAFEGRYDEVACARCGLFLEPGDRVARPACCPALFHSGETAAEPHEPLHCLDYDPKCPSCGRLRESAAWTPEQLDD